MTNDTDNANITVLNRIINDYRSKAIQLRRNAKWIIVATILTLVTAISIFVLAEYLTRNSNTLKLDQYHDEIKKHIDILNSPNSPLDAIVFNRGERVNQNESLKNQIKTLDDSMKNIVIYRYNTASVISKLDSLLLKVDRINQASKDNLLSFLTTLSTRVGAILILIFISQILLRLFRYYTRLANYYDARANALELHSINDQYSFISVINLLSPDAYDIGSPKAPMETILGLFNAIKTNSK